MAKSNESWMNDTLYTEIAILETKNKAIKKTLNDRDVPVSPFYKDCLIVDMEVNKNQIMFLEEKIRKNPVLYWYD